MYEVKLNVLLPGADLASETIVLVNAASAIEAGRMMSRWFQAPECRARFADATIASIVPIA